MSSGRPRVVIVGAGFGGLAAARSLRHAAVDVLVVDKHNYHLFQPLLYQVASALLDPSEIAYPVRAALRRTGNADFRLARVDAVAVEARTVHTDAGDISYDYLVVAAGSVNNFFGVGSVEERAHGLKALEEALSLRNHLLQAAERAAWAEDESERQRLLTVVLVGAGPTGVELSGAISELVHLVLRKDFPRLDLSRMRIVLLEAGDDVLPAFAPRLRRAALRTLQSKGVEVRLHAAVSAANDEGVVLSSGEEIPTSTIVWTAGVRGAPLAASLGVPLNRQGRVAVTDTLQLPQHPEVFVIGDLAELHQDGAPLPMLAAVAMQQGHHVATTIAGSLSGVQPRPFRYRDKGIMATIGRNSAVAQIGPLRFTGFVGWVMWLGIHLILLVGFRSKVIALFNWAWDYFFYDRPVRLIARPERLEATDASHTPHPPER
jgi:NADH dehydrogenase